jgi:predicted AAA+ superfamily ATPase
MISRILVDRLRQKLFKQKAIIVLGPRQVGKTTLLKNLAFDPDEILWMNADEIDVQQRLSEVSSGSFKALLGKKKIFIISRINNGPVVFWIYPSCKRSNTINDYNFITFF